MEIIAIVLSSVLLMFNIYMLIRNKMVHRFRHEIIKMACDYQVRHAFEVKDNAYIWFVGKYSYDEFLYSLKPLRLECWYTEEELNRINS